MKIKLATIGLLTAVSLSVAPLSPASAHGYHHSGFPIIGGLFAAGAVVGAAAVAVATAPVRIAATAVSPYPYYAPTPVYYAPRPAYYPVYGYAPAPVVYGYQQPVYAYPAQ